MGIPTSLVELLNQSRNGNGGGKYYGGRMDEDGLPYFGNTPPAMLKSEEAETRLAPRGVAHNGHFDTANPLENAKYLQVLNLLANSLATLACEPIRTVCKDEKGNATIKVYIEWVVRQMEDVQPSMSGPFPRTE